MYLLIFPLPSPNCCQFFRWNVKSRPFFTINKSSSSTVFSFYYFILPWTIIVPLFVKGFFNIKRFPTKKLHHLIYLDVWKPFQPAFTCLTSAMKHQYLKYVKYTWKLWVKYVKSPIKAPEQNEWCCSGVFIFDIKGILTTKLNVCNWAFLWR